MGTIHPVSWHGQLCSSAAIVKVASPTTNDTPWASDCEEEANGVPRGKVCEQTPLRLGLREY